MANGSEDLIFTGGFDLTSARNNFEEFLKWMVKRLENFKGEVKINTSSNPTQAKNNPNTIAIKSQEELQNQYLESEIRLERLTEKANKYANALKTGVDKAVADSTLTEKEANAIRDKTDGLLRRLSERYEDLSAKIAQNEKVTNADVLAIEKLERLTARVGTQFNQSGQKIQSNQPKPTEAPDTSKIKAAEVAQNELREAYTKSAQSVNRLTVEGEGYAKVFLKDVDSAVRKGLVSEQAANVARNRAEDILKRLATRYTDLKDKVLLQGKATEDDVLAMRKLERELENVSTELERTGQNLSKTSIGFKESQKASDRFFKGIVIGGFALQQAGGAMNLYITQPLIAAGKEILKFTLQFDTLETLLRERSNKSEKEIAQSISVVTEAAKLRNFELEQAVTLYSKLFEATRGRLNDKEYQTVAKGLSAVSSQLEAGERRSFIGQIQDVLGGGDVAGLEKTLSLAPLLKTYFDEIKSAAAGAKTDAEIMMEAFIALNAQAPINDLETKFKNIGVTVQTMGERFGRVYKDDLSKFIDYINEKVFPTVDRLLTQFENLDSGTQNLILGAVASVAALAPVAFTLGTLAVVSGGVYYAIQGVSAIIAVLTDSTLAASIATKSLTSLLLSSETATTGVASVFAGLTATTVALVAGFTAVALWGGYVIAKSKLLRSEFYELGKSGVEVFSTLGEITGELYELVKAFSETTIAVAAFKAIFQATEVSLAIVTRTMRLVSSGFTEGFTAIATVLKFVNDIINDGLDVAFARLDVRLGEMQQRIISLLPYGKELVDFFSQLLGGRSLDEMQAERVKQLKAVEQGLDKFKGKAGDTATTFESLNKKQAVWNQVNKNSEDYLKALTKQITESSEALRKNTAEMIRNAEARNAASKGVQLDDQAKQQDEKREKLDLSNPEKAAEAIRLFNLAAELKRKSEFTKRIADAKNQYREAVEEISTEIGKLADEAEKAQASGALYLRALQERLNKANATGAAEVKKVLDDALTVRPEEQLGQYIRNAVARLNIQANDIRAALNNYDVFNTQQQAEGRKFLADILKAQEEKGDAKSIAQLQSASDDIKKVEEEIRKQISDVLAISPEDLAIGDKIEQIDQRFGDILKLYTGGTLSNGQEIKYGLLGYEKLINEIENKNNSADFEMKLDDIKKRLKSIPAELFKQQQEQLRDLTQGLINSYKETQEQTKKLVDEINKNRLSQIDVYVDMARAGFGDKEGFEKLLKQLNETSAAYQASSTVVDKLKALRRNWQDNVGASLSTNQIETTVGVNTQFDDLGKLIKDIESNGITEDKIKKIVTILSSIAGLMATVNLSDVPKDGKSIFSEALKQINEVLTQTVELDDKSREIYERIQKLRQDYRIAEKEAAVENISTRRDILELELQISEERRKQGLQIQGKGVIGLAKTFLDILRGESAVIAEAQKKRLEIEIQINKAEYELSLAKLQIEQEITVERLRQLGKSEEEIELVKKRQETEIENLKRKYELEDELLKMQREGISEYGGSIGDIILGGLGDVIGGIFKKKKKDKEEDSTVPPVISDDSADTTDKNADRQKSALEKLSGGLLKTKNLIFAVGNAIAQMEELSVQSMLKAIKARLDAKAKEYLVYSLEYAALSIASLIFGDTKAAGEAAVASGLYLAAAGAAKGASALIGSFIKDDNKVAQNAKNNEANVSDDDETKNRIIRQKAYEVYINIDSRQDEGIIQRIQINAINSNGELSNLSRNSQAGFPNTPV